mgnify:CR=1 FL=1
MERVKCLIIGSGPAGYTAAIYASRANLAPVLYEGNLSGGQLTTTSEVENFPGYTDGVNGFDMMDDIRRQAERFGTEIRMGTVTKADLSSSPYNIYIDDNTQIEAETVIICTGASAKYLGLEDEKKYAGRGVSACATCDGFFYRKKIVAVVGGGDTACEEASYLSTLAEKVYLVVRKDYLRASDIMQKRVLSNPKIEVLFNHNVEGLFGEGKVQGMKLVRNLGKEDESHYEKEIDDAFTEWEKATEHKIFFEEDTKNPNIIIKFEENTSTTEENLNYVMASTKIKINSKFLENMNIIFYTKTPYGDYYTNKQVFNTALHEIAHALGFMGHSNNDENILYIKENSYSVKNNIRNRLTEADINTIINIFLDFFIQHLFILI